MTNTPAPHHKARKRFGQNFLIDQNIISMIVRSIAPRELDNIVEIGPGQGAITKLLLEACPKLDVVELDRDLIPVLLSQFANHKQFKIHQADALKFNFADLKKEKDDKLRIVGNLPYNISTPLIFHLLSFEGMVKDMHFMLQKEVVERLVAEPRNKNYGRLSIMAQYYCQVEYLFDVAPGCFRPIPKVDSAIVRLTPHEQRPFEAKDIKLLKTVVTTAFQQRRKTLRNALKPLIQDVDPEYLDIDLSLRPESLSVETYVELSNRLFTLENNT